MKAYHNHIIIKQIVPAAIDAFAVFAWWSLEHSGEAQESTLKLQYDRIPCFALTEACRLNSDDECDRKTGGAGISNGYQKIVPCVFSGEGYGIYSPAEMAECDNLKFLGVMFENDKEQCDWMEMAQSRFRGYIRIREKKLAQQQKNDS